MQRRKLLKLLSATPLLSVLSPEQAAASGIPEQGTVLDKDAYHLVIYGATPGGVACAVRAAREGLKVLLVNHNQHLGGMFVNGLGTMDTLYNGARAPIYDELRYEIYDYYRRKYGKKSPQYTAAMPGFSKTKYESHVMEELINKMLGREKLITIIRDFYPELVSREDSLLRTVTFREKHKDKRITVRANVFADCSYEGDLAAVAKTPLRIGRESTHEYGEPHAGVAYMQKDFWPPSKAADEPGLSLARSLNLSSYDSWSEIIRPATTGAAHPAIQAFNLRTTLTDNPENRIIPGKPKNYDHEIMKKFHAGIESGGLRVPNSKTSWNHPELIGEQNLYVEGDWKERERVTEKFRDYTLGLLYFAQNDPEVPKATREKMQQLGLSADEYKDNGNLPYEIYVREARRLSGRAVFTEKDASLAPGLKRAPIQNDSISVTEWFMDSHACTDQQVAGSKQEGEVMLKNRTFPGQVPFDCILPKDLENLIVPVCLSASHIGWGTIRLEPTWMSIGEAAAYAVSMAISKKNNLSRIRRDNLLRLLARKGIMITFFSDVEAREYANWYPAIQYLGTKGFFGSYEAHVNEILTTALSEAWLAQAGRMATNPSFKPGDFAAEIFASESSTGPGLSAKDFTRKLFEIKGIPKQSAAPLLSRLDIRPDALITRGDACRLIFEATEGL